MKVHELIKWLQTFEDQDAIVKVLHNEGGGGYYAQGGVTKEVIFDPAKHCEYTDLRGNAFARKYAYWDVRTLLLGIDEN